MGEIQRRREKWGELDGDGNGNRALNIAHQIAVVVLNAQRSASRVADERIQVQFNRIAARICELSSVTNPPATRRSVETRDDGNRNGGFRPTNQLKVSIKSEIVALQIRKIV